MQISKQSQVKPAVNIHQCCHSMQPKTDECFDTQQARSTASHVTLESNVWAVCATGGW